MNVSPLNHSSEDEQAGRDGPNRDPEQEAADEGSTVLMFLVLICERLSLVKKTRKKTKKTKRMMMKKKKKRRR